MDNVTQKEKENGTKPRFLLQIYRLNVPIVKKKKTKDIFNNTTKKWKKMFNCLLLVEDEHLCIMYKEDLST